ncbi:MAG: hypothetical protein GY882_12890 [Actinomycetia bacterium]|nr:hypothetical protein [Actinomycetes bacterium]MCP4843477.1 hypothetical protein [Actinomycetes bacterium]
MPRSSDFAQRSESFGFGTDQPWALHALRLVLNAPRSYEPLVDAWEGRFPGSKAALERLTDMGFVDYQGPLVFDTVSGAVADKPSRRVRRFVITSPGQRALASFRADARNFEDQFPKVTRPQAVCVLEFLSAFDVTLSNRRFGTSLARAASLGGFRDRRAQAWRDTLLDRKWIREIDEQHADVREVIPAHWRPTKLLCQQLTDVIDALPSAPDSLRVEFRTGRRRFRPDIEITRVGTGGVTDYDHDVTTCLVAAQLIAADSYMADGLFRMDGRLVLPVDESVRPWRFDSASSGSVFYLPDLECRARTTGSPLRRVVVEYERRATRRDGWSHLERFVGWMATSSHPAESADCLFVVDSNRKKAVYVGLVEAFASWADDRPELFPANPLTLGVTTLEELAAASDPLDANSWDRVVIEADTDAPRAPVLHPKRGGASTPYELYFGG